MKRFQIVRNNNKMNLVFKKKIRGISVPMYTGDILFITDRIHLINTKEGIYAEFDNDDNYVKSTPSFYIHDKEQVIVLTKQFAELLINGDLSLKGFDTSCLKRKLIAA